MQNEKRKRLYDHARYTRNSKDWAAYKIIVDLQQAHDAYCNHMFDATYTSNCKSFGPISKIFNMTFQTYVATLQVNNKELLTPSDKIKLMH